MPRSDRSASYGPEYEALLLRAHAACTCSVSKVYEMPLTTPSMASSIKSKIYAYFKSLRREGLRPDLIQLADQLSLRVSGTSLEFFLRADSWDAVAIRQALGLVDGFADLGSESGIVSAPAGRSESAKEKLEAIRRREGK